MVLQQCVPKFQKNQAMHLYFITVSVIVQKEEFKFPLNGRKNEETEPNFGQL